MIQFSNIIISADKNFDGIYYMYIEVVEVFFIKIFMWKSTAIIGTCTRISDSLWESTVPRQKSHIYSLDS